MDVMLAVVLDHYGPITRSLRGLKGGAVAVEAVGVEVLTVVVLTHREAALIIALAAAAVAPEEACQVGS